jgi:hypothetical protein
LFVLLGITTLSCTQWDIKVSSYLMRLHDVLLGSPQKAATNKA